jgi:hypothetical protein
MPKASGMPLKAVQGPARPQPKSRGIMHQTPPSPDPRKTAPAGGSGDPKIAADVKASPGGPDPRQQRY